MSSNIKINGLKIVYERTCEAVNPKATLVFLHGWGGSGRSWGENIIGMSKVFDCIALEFPGFGISDTPEKVWGVEDYAEFVHGFTQKLGLHKFVLVGKSFGGRVAIYYASKRPDMLLRLVLVAAAGIERPKTTARLKIYLASFGKWLTKKLFPTLEGIIREVYYRVLNINRDSSDYKWEVRKIVTRTNLSKIASSIDVPTLIVWGDTDTILPISVGRKLYTLVRNSKFVVIPGGHNAHVESAWQFNSILADYLRPS